MMQPKDAFGMANSVDLDQAAPLRSSLILGCTVCSDLSVPILRIFSSSGRSPGRAIVLPPALALAAALGLAKSLKLKFFM